MKTLAGLIAVLLPAVVALAGGCQERPRLAAEPQSGGVDLAMAVPLLLDPAAALSPDVRYEANNALMRQGLDGGPAVAGRWRAVAARTRGLFVLRDSLWNQQDLPRDPDPLALTLPPSWVLLAAVQRGVAPVRSFALDDEAAWGALTEPAALFGGFPASRTLFELARSDRRSAASADRRAITGARQSLQQLAALTSTLSRAGTDGWRAVVAAGVAAIAENDRRYFGSAIRREYIIPIFVENPAPHEAAEGKGFSMPGLDAPEAIRRAVTVEACRARLADGDIALERYDLSDPMAVDRALTLLGGIIPEGGEGGHRVWLWVTGALVPDKVLRGEGALAYVDAFWRRAADAPIDLSRLRLFNKPGEAVSAGLAERYRAYRQASLFMSVEADVNALRRGLL